MEFLYTNGLTHGHISANSLRITDNYAFALGDFMISTTHCSVDGSSAEADGSESSFSGVRGVISATASDFLKTYLEKVKASDGQAITEDDGLTISLKNELIRQDWQNFVGAFYFPKQSKVLTDERVKGWVNSTNG